jgi:RNA polymerase I-specific transcription initiation factor RRN3
VLYVFLHRWRELVDNGGQNEFGDEQEDAQNGGFNSPVMNRLPKEMDGFQRVLTCRLDPLKICSQNVVQEFAQLSHHLNIFYVFNFLSPPTSRSSTPIPTVSNANISSNGNSVAAIQAQKTYHHRNQDLMYLKLETLESFFPFDPFELKGSSRFVDHLYREYEPFYSDDEEDEEDDEDGDDNESSSSSTDDDARSKSESVSSGGHVFDSRSERLGEDDDENGDSMMEEDDDGDDDDDGDEERRVQMELLRHTAAFRK